MPTLTWNGKEEAVEAKDQVPYRLLEEDPALGYGDADAGNVIVQGDNLAALKALLPYYKGRVRCIYADLLSVIDVGTLGSTEVDQIPFSA